MDMLAGSIYSCVLETLTFDGPMSKTLVKRRLDDDDMFFALETDHNCWPICLMLLDWRATSGPHCVFDDTLELPW